MSRTHDDPEAGGRGYDAALLRRLLRLPPALPLATAGAHHPAAAQLGAGAGRAGADPAGARRRDSRTGPGTADAPGGTLSRRRCSSSSWSTTAGPCSRRWIGQRVMYDLRMEIFGHLQRLSIAYFDRNPVGRLMTRVTSRRRDAQRALLLRRRDRLRRRVHPARHHGA